MYSFVTGVLYLSLAEMFVICWFTLRKWSSKLHAYLFFSCVVNLVYNAAFILQLQARDEAAFISAFKIGYLGRLWIGMSLFLFIVEICNVYIPEAVKAALGLAHVIIYIPILEIEHTGLYYKYMEFVIDDGFPKLIHSGGPLYYVQTALNLLYTFAGIYFIARTFIHEKNPVAKKRYMMLTIAIFVVGASYVVYFFKLVPLARKFDVMIFAYAVSNALMLIAIIKYKMLDARAAARNYVVDELSEGIIVVDASGRISYHNKPAQKLFPVLANKGLIAEHSGDVIKAIGDAIDKGETIRMNDRIYMPKANDLIDDGVRVGTLYALDDNTDQYDYMKELRKQRQIADEANKAKSKFLANMSHEIRTPINAILGMDEMILRESSEREIREYAGDIMESGRTLLTIVNDILDFSKVEEGKMEIIPVSYEPGVLVNDLVNMMKDRAAQKGLAFNVDVDTGIPRLLKGDEIRIKQCALNLLTNAVKYTEKGSVSLTVGFRKFDEGRIRLDFTIADTGAGIRPEDLEDLFSPFKRIDEKKNRSIEGTGLGISITKSLLELMGSELNVSSEYGKGSVFSFGIEQEVLNTETIGDYEQRSGNGREEIKKYSELFHAPSANILVVDDIRMNLTVMTKLLKKTMMNVDTATGGKEAIRMAAEKDYDIIFIDHLMPEMDGIETLKHLKEQDRGTGTVYVALTANAISGAREMYMEEGFSDYVSKPVEGDKLEKLIKSYLPPEKLLDTPISV